MANSSVVALMLTAALVSACGGSETTFEVGNPRVEKRKNVLGQPEYVMVYDVKGSSDGYATCDYRLLDSGGDVVYEGRLSLNRSEGTGEEVVQPDDPDLSGTPATAEIDPCEPR